MTPESLQPRREISKNPPKGRFRQMTTATPHPKSFADQPEETTCVKRCNGFLRRPSPTHTRPSAFYVAQAFHLSSRLLFGLKPPAGLLAPWWTRAHRHLSSRPTDTLACATVICTVHIPMESGAFHTDTRRQITCARSFGGAGLRTPSMRPAAAWSQNTVMSYLSPATEWNDSICSRVVSLRIPYLERETWLTTISPTHRRGHPAPSRARGMKPTFTRPHPPHHQRSAATQCWHSSSAVSLSVLSFCTSCLTALAPTTPRPQAAPLSTVRPTSQSSRAHPPRKLHPQQSQRQHHKSQPPQMMQAKLHLNLRPLTDTVGCDSIDTVTQAGRFATPGFCMSRHHGEARKARSC